MIKIKHTPENSNTRQAGRNILLVKLLIAETL
jgi:hypothetical protein